ncbi:MAG TPA: CYTH and CHAD domain-containing protein [Actinospica sp.]|nr:CYTH and CHAD domain-containing protein [Actinospica sp.]
MGHAGYDTERETEWKYEAPSGAHVPDLSGLPRVAVQSDGGRQTLSAIYYDTADLLLARHGITLRRRTGGHDSGWHLKLPDRPGTRTEIRMPLGDETPAELTAVVTARLRGRPVEPVARITTRRRRHILLDAAGASLAEVAADDVTAEAFGEPPSTDRWAEVEVELTGGDIELLQAADTRLREHGLTLSARASKLERALGARLGRAPDGPEAAGGRSEATAGEAVLAWLRIQRDELVGQDARLRMGEPEAVHDMRVAARRARSALQAYRRVLRPERTGGIVEDLRWLGRELGQARDTEVVADRLETQLAGLPPELVIGPVARRLAAYRTPRRAAVRTSSHRTLDSGRYLGLLDALDELVDAPPFGPGAGRPAARALPEFAARALRRVAKRAADAFIAEPGEQQDLALHATRKAAKRARYAVEAALLATDERALRRTARSLKELQTALGDHQDTVVARSVLVRMAADAQAEGENGFTYGVLYAREAESAAESLDRARKVWHAANRAKRMSRMR